MLIGGDRQSGKFTFKYHTDMFKNSAGERVPVKRPRIEVYLRRYSEKADPENNPEFRAFALVDSGADICHVPRQIADILKLELDPATRKQSVGAGGKFWTYRTKMYLEILNKGRRVDVTMVDVVVTETDPDGVDPIVNILLGRSGLFDNFEITFNDPGQYLIFKHIQKRKK